MTDLDKDATRHRNARRNVLKKYRDAGVCQFGHDLTAPGVLKAYARTYRCMKCGPSNPAMCRSGKHVKVPGQQRCAACRKVYSSQPYRSSGPPLLGQLPPAEVLDGAACHIGIAALFEPRDRDETNIEFYARTVQAQAVCAECPVAALCYADALEHKRLGVYGGQVLVPKSHKPKAAA